MPVRDVQLPLFLNDPIQDSSPESLPVADGLDATAAPSPAMEPAGSDEAEMARLVEVAVAELRAAKGDARLERAAVCRWFKRGTTAGFPMETLVDVLGVSSDVLDGADYDDDAAQRLMNEIVVGISDAEIALAAL